MIQKTTMSYDNENRMATFAEDGTLNTYTYDSYGCKKALNVGGSLSTIICDGTDYLQVRGQTSAKTLHQGSFRVSAPM